MSIRAYLGHHAAPSDELGIDLLPRLFLVSLDGLEETDEVFILRVVVFDEGIEALGQICADGRIVVISNGRVA